MPTEILQVEEANQKPQRVRISIISIIIQVVNAKKCKRFRSLSMETDGYIELLPNGRFRYYRHFNSVIFWPWSPSAADFDKMDWRIDTRHLD